MKADWDRAPSWANWFFWDGFYSMWCYSEFEPKRLFGFGPFRPRGSHMHRSLLFGPDWAGNARLSVQSRPQATTPQPEGQGDGN